MRETAPRRHLLVVQAGEPTRTEATVPHLSTATCLYKAMVTAAGHARRPRLRRRGTRGPRSGPAHCGAQWAGTGSCYGDQESCPPLGALAVVASAIGAP